MRPARGAGATTLATALLTGALLVLLTWAASVGPGQVVHGRPGGSQVARVEPTPTATPTPTGSPVPDPRQHALDRRPSQGSWFGTLLAVLGVLALGYLGSRLLRRLWAAWRDREIGPPDPEEVAFEVLTPPAMAREMAADAAQQQRLLTGGTPRNAIVGCWDRVEQVAARVGLERRAWETPAEFTLRFFDVLGADAHPVQQLATLYREARFSDHELGEADRHTAQQALAAIHCSLGSTV